MSAKRWPPPGFPAVEGLHALTADWAIRLPEPFARRVEDGSLVLWRPGLTLWLDVWGNNHGESRQERLARIKEEASPARLAEREAEEDGLTRYSYRLRDEGEDGPVESVYGFILGDEGHLQLAVCFDDPGDEDRAYRLVDGVERRGRP